MKLTKTTVAKLKLPEGKSDHIFWDSDPRNFGVRIREGGSRTYVIQYKTKSGATRRMTIGTMALTLAQARREAKKQLNYIAQGGDPQGEKKDARQIGTFKSIAEDFIEHQEKRRRASTVYATKLYLMGTAAYPYCKPLHALRPDEIGRKEIASILRTISKNHGDISADRARSALSAMFAWAIGEGLCGESYSNPVIGTNKREPDTNDSPARALAESEIAEIWFAADDGEDFGKIVRLALLTGCRRNEIALVQWAEVKDDLISLPGSRTKNHLDFDVPLSDMARGLIGQRLSAERKFVFGRHDTGFSGFSKAKRLLDAKLKGVSPWRLHDIRHTVSTGLSELGVEPHIVEAVLNHISGHRAGVAGRYNHAKYNEQKRAALNLWASEIAGILARASGANVERLRPRDNGLVRAGSR
jgi:integrase